METRTKTCGPLVAQLCRGKSLVEFRGGGGVGGSSSPWLVSSGKWLERGAQSCALRHHGHGLGVPEERGPPGAAHLGPSEE